MKRVVVHIERLVLNGFQHEQRQAIAAGLQQELGRAFGDRACAQPSGPAPVGQGSLPQRIGADVARHLHKEIRK